MLIRLLKRLFNALSRIFGYGFVKVQSINEKTSFQIFQYRKSDCTFDYEEYKNTQVKGNKRKINKVYANEEHVLFLSNYIKRVIGTVDFGICHGTRRGKEQEWFRKYLGCEVIGTEISDTAEQFPHTIQWDFHETKPEWINSVDFIYSNSLDHSYDPEKCLTAWMRCIKKGGICIIEHSLGHEIARKLDPFGAPISQMPYLIQSWGRGKYDVKEIIDAPESDALNYAKFIIVHRF